MKTSLGRWRTLDDIEIALMKRMKMNGLARDYIMSFFVQPSRKISSAVTSEVMVKFPEITPASTEEAELFIARRLNQALAIEPFHGFGPTSTLRVREILQLTREGQTALPGFESHFAEFKVEAPNDKIGRAKLAKSMAAFANNQGGYIFLGIENEGAIVGLPSSIRIEKFWDQLSDVVTATFSPFFRWERNVLRFASKRVGVIYVHEAAEKPVVAARDCTNEIASGDVYFRYNRSSERIKAVDLFTILAGRDKRAAASGA